MREIKFRGKRKDNGEWVCGDILRDRNTIYIIPNESSIWVNYLQKEDESYHTELKVIAYKVDPETIGQFTGLKDKNGVDIYEGDWLRVAPGYSSYIEFKDGSFLSIYSHPEDGEELLMEDITPNECEIIGNVHETPTT